jgi:hypothetical protein
MAAPAAMSVSRRHFPAGSTIFELGLGDTTIDGKAAVKTLQAHKENPAIQASWETVKGAGMAGTRLWLLLYPRLWPFGRLTIVKVTDFVATTVMAVSDQHKKVLKAC